MGQNIATFFFVDLKTFLSKVGYLRLVDGQLKFITWSLKKEVLLVPIEALFITDIMDNFLQSIDSKKRVIFYACERDSIAKFFPGDYEDYCVKPGKLTLKFSLLTPLCERLGIDDRFQVIFCDEWTNLLAYQMLAHNDYKMTDLPSEYISNGLSSFYLTMLMVLKSFKNFEMAGDEKAKFRSHVESS